MMHDFLSNNREELTARCRAKVAARSGRSVTDEQLQNGIPLFLDQLIRTLVIEQTGRPLLSRAISGPSGGDPALSEVSVSAAQHGKDLLAMGLTVDQVVHDYGDLCQAITDLAVERDAPFQIDEFRTLNRCLDNAISDAVTEFSYQRDIGAANANELESDKRIGFFAHELRNLLGTASLAFAAAKAGGLNLNGATGTILERSLRGLEKLIAHSLEDVRVLDDGALALKTFSLADCIEEITQASNLSAEAHDCVLLVPAIDADLALAGERDLILAAIANLVQNAFKFTQCDSEVILSAYASGDRILIEVQDHCGGLGDGVVESMFLPFSQFDKNRAGIGLGLTIARQNIIANQGELTVRNLPGIGCIFTIRMPRYSVVN